MISTESANAAGKAGEAAAPTKSPSIRRSNADLAAAAFLKFRRRTPLLTMSTSSSSSSASIKCTAAFVCDREEEALPLDVEFGSLASSCAANCRTKGTTRMLLSRPPPWQSALKLPFAPVANRPNSIDTSARARRSRADAGSVFPTAAATFSHHAPAALAKLASPTRPANTGSKLLHNVSLLRSDAPSHSRLGVRSAMSALRAAAWHAK